MKELLDKWIIATCKRRPGGVVFVGSIIYHEVYYAIIYCTYDTLFELRIVKNLDTLDAIYNDLLYSVIMQGNNTPLIKSKSWYFNERDFQLDDNAETYIGNGIRMAFENSFIEYPQVEDNAIVIDIIDKLKGIYDKFMLHEVRLEEL